MMYIFNTRNVDRRFSEFHSPLEDLTCWNLIRFNIFVLALTYPFQLILSVLILILRLFHFPNMISDLGKTTRLAVPKMLQRMISRCNLLQRDLSSGVTESLLVRDDERSISACTIEMGLLLIGHEILIDTRRTHCRPSASCLSRSCCTFSSICTTYVTLFLPEFRHGILKSKS